MWWISSFLIEKKGKGTWSASSSVTQLVIKKFGKRKMYARFQENIWAADLAEMGSLSCKDWGIKYLMCVIGFSSNTLKSLKD